MRPDPGSISNSPFAFLTSRLCRTAPDRPSTAASTSPSKTLPRDLPSGLMLTPNSVPRSSTAEPGPETTKPSAPSGTLARSLPLLQAIRSTESSSMSAGPSTITMTPLSIERIARPSRTRSHPLGRTSPSRGTRPPSISHRTPSARMTTATPSAASTLGAGTGAGSGRSAIGLWRPRRTAPPRPARPRGGRPAPSRRPPRPARTGRREGRLGHRRSPGRRGRRPAPAAGPTAASAASTSRPACRPARSRTRSPGGAARGAP